MKGSWIGLLFSMFLSFEPAFCQSSTPVSTSDALSVALVKKAGSHSDITAVVQQSPDPLSTSCCAVNAPGTLLCVVEKKLGVREGGGMQVTLIVLVLAVCIGVAAVVVAMLGDRSRGKGK